MPVHTVPPRQVSLEWWLETAKRIIEDPSNRARFETNGWQKNYYATVAMRSMGSVFQGIKDAAEAITALRTYMPTGDAPIVEAV